MKKTESHLKTIEHILQQIEKITKKNLENQYNVTKKPVTFGSHSPKKKYRKK